MWTDGLCIYKLIFRVDAGSVHDVERSGKSVLVYFSSSFHPEEDLYVKAFIMKSDEFRLTEC